MTQPNPKDPQADIREALLKIPVRMGKRELGGLLSAQDIDQILALFQTHQQELLTELLDNNWHYFRTCLSCGKNWWGLHCPHDGYQNPCPACYEKPAQVLLKPIKSNTCGCEFVIPVSVIQSKIGELNG